MTSLKLGGDAESWSANPEEHFVDESSGKKVQVTKVGGRDFHWVETAEPHAGRRRQILKAHPEITKLFGPEPLTFPIVIAILVAQVAMASFVQNQPWWVLIALAYVVGGTVNHSLQLAAHELSHSLCFGVPALDKTLAIVSNLATGVPSGITFIKYHMEHHLWQGTDFIDTDVPCDFEVRVFTNAPMKLLWCFLQPFFYSLRPVILNPKKPGVWEAFNYVAVFAFDYWVYNTLGGKALAYLIIGTFLGLGFHPLAGHFIAEHYEFTRGTETYSYYGLLNWFMFNVGYHNEHHDFPKIAWSNLRKVREVAPEFYNDLPQYDSYYPVFYDYIMNPKMGPWSRVKRKAGAGKKKKN
jgi:sphingolipid delta-4 desaturase